MKKNATSLRELKAQECDKKKPFFSFFNSLPKVKENKKSVRLKGFFPKLDEPPIITISSTVKNGNSSQFPEDIYEEIHISEPENESNQHFI